MGDAMMTPLSAADAARWFFETMQRRKAATPGAPPPPGAPAPAPTGAAPSPAVAQAQASLHQGQFEHADTPAPAPLATGSTAPAGPKKDEETPGTKAYDLAQQRAALQAIPDTPPGARQKHLDQMKAQIQAEAQIFSQQ